MSQVKSVPDGMHTVTPHLVCSDAAKAIEFYCRAFNATEMIRVPGPGGKLIHACVRIGDSLVMLVDENPQWECLSPLTLKGSPVTIHLQVDDVDAVFSQAIKAGATVTMPVNDMFWGDRYGVVKDPFGHQWSIATHVRDVSLEEIRQAVAVECAG